ncbi:MAG: hypothetical protein IKU03_04600 [Bacteroidales bacterium]|nr:hypothetical protein [Bacteroidales bacterium]
MQPLENDKILPFANLGIQMRMEDYLLDKEPVIQRQYQLNPWFTPEFIKLSFQLVAEMLNLEYLKHKFNKGYPQLPNKTVGLVPDGMRPLSAFPDLLCVLMAGCDCALKQHPKDELLLPLLLQELEALEPTIRGRVRMVEKLPPCDAVIVQDMEQNTAVWEHYLQKIPHLVRPYQSSVALLTGKESPQELTALASDISWFFGRPRAAVRTLLVPKDYDFVPLLQSLARQSHSLAQHHQLLNHLEYQKSVRLMNKRFYMDAGTFLLVEDTQEIAPTGVIRYVYYQKPSEVQEWLRERKETIYTVVGQGFDGMETKPFGSVYADKDLSLDTTIHFLQTIG